MMKAIFVSTLVSIAVLLPRWTAAAQDYSVPEIKISTEKVRYEGKIYYSHVVKEKQTLFSISKVYGVPLEDIYAANPGLEQNGLQKDKIILIPVPGQEEQTAKESKPTKETKPAKEPKSTKEQMPVKEQVKEELSLQQEEVKAEAAANETFRYDGESVNHKVKWYEDIESIATSYGVSVTAIMKVNGLTDKTLKPRQILIIPTGGDIQGETESDPRSLFNANTVAEDTGDSAEANEEVPPTPDFERKTDISIMLMLPIEASADGIEYHYMDFYSGALLAAKDKSEEGLHISLNVVDVTSGIPEISSQEYEASDVIIGPVSTEQIETVLSEVPADKYVVSPIDPRVESIVGNHPNLIHTPTPASAQMRDMFRWISEDMKEGDRTVVIYEKNSKEAQVDSEINKMLDESNLSAGKLSYGILEGRDQLENLARLMNKEASNRIVIASEKETFLNDAVRNINLMIHEGYDIVLYSPSKIRSIETIEVDNLHNSNTHISTTYNVDYDNKKVQSFLMKYRALFNTEPGAFSFQGYDMVALFTDMIAQYGDRWTEMISGEKAPQLHESFNFYKCDDGGWMNKAVIRVIYEPNYGIRYQEKEQSSPAVQE